MKNRLDHLAPLVLILLLLVLLVRPVAASPVIIDFTPNYTNYWMKSSQTLPFAITCENEDPLNYRWYVDGVQKSSAQNFNLTGASYGPGNYEVKGICDNGQGDLASQTFNLEIIDESEFTIVVLPDTQHYTRLNNGLFESQTDWIREINQNLGIEFVIHEGDIVHNTGASLAEQWAIADESMSTLDGVVPYGLVVGNHDYDNKLMQNRDATYFNSHFSETRFQARFPQNFAGNFDSGNATHFKFDHENLKFSVILVPFCPTDETLNWADETINNNQDRRIIFATHAYLIKTGERFSDTVAVAGGGCKPPVHPAAVDGNTGEEIWQKVLKKYPNVFLTLNGHSHGSVPGDEAAHSVAVGNKKNQVYQVFANYQTQPVFPGGGEGFLRIMKFSPEENRVEVRTYSPWLDEFMTSWNSDPSYGVRNNFEFTYPMNTPRIAGVYVDSKDNFAYVKWQTDFGSTSRVVYGPTPEYGNEMVNENLITNKSVLIRPLNPDTKYYYYVESCDAVGNCSSSGQRHFTTFPTQTGTDPAPVKLEARIEPL